MGAQWKHTGRLQNSAKRGAFISKLVKEIVVATKSGEPHPEYNPRLKAAIEAAKKGSVPRENIERAIKKGAGQLSDGSTYELVTYEGFTPHQVPVIVECLTDNKNRTAADIRMLFRKGSLGSVNWMFQRLGIIEGNQLFTPEASSKILSPDLEAIGIEVGANDVEWITKVEPSLPFPQTLEARFYCDLHEIDLVTQLLIEKGWTITQAELGYLCKNFLELEDSKVIEVIHFLDNLDDHDDVHRIYAGLKIK